MRAFPQLFLLLAFCGCAVAAEDRAAAKAELKALASESSRLSRAFNLVHEVVAPSVVSIHTKAATVNAVVNRFGEVVALASGEPVEVGEGSGFIVRSERGTSWIVTNAHVVLQTNAEQQFVRGRDNQQVWYDRVAVELNEGRQIEAEPVGYNLETDLAVVKVSEANLPAVDWADSDRVHVGDWVVALGYPLAIGYSATAGIISATDRSTGVMHGMRGFDSFIQTDAAINPGNSGGPLVDLEGRVIGVNSSIKSTTGANIGLGFAIPSNLVKRITDDLITLGYVRWSAIGIDPVDADSEVTGGLPAVPQVLIRAVVPGTPADAAGLRAGDALIAVNGFAVRNLMQYRARFAGCAIGQPLNLRLRRDGKDIDVTVKPIALDEVLRRDQAARPVAVPSLALRQLGLSLGQDDRPGLVVTAVSAGGRAAAAHLHVGDRVLQERTAGPLRTLDDARTLVEAKEAVLQVYQNGRGVWVRLRH